MLDMQGDLQFFGELATSSKFTFVPTSGHVPIATGPTQYVTDNMRSCAFQAL